MLAATALSVVRTRSLFAIVALSGVFSLLSALLFITWDAFYFASKEGIRGAQVSRVLGDVYKGQEASKTLAEGGATCEMK